MAKSHFNLGDFIATVRQGSLARTNRFEIIIPKPPKLAAEGDRLVSLFAEQASLPPTILNVRSYKVWGPTFHRPQSVEYGGEGYTAVFHVDRDMVVKKFFDEWMNLIVDNDNFMVSYQEDYVTTIDINQINEQNDITYTAQLVNAFPRSMNLMELNNASTNQTHRLTVTFAYELWRTQTSTQPVQAPLSRTAPQVPRGEPVPYRGGQSAPGGGTSGRFDGGGGTFSGAGAEGSY